MAEIHARRGALEQARDIYLRTAEIYVEQGFQRKAMTVYKSVLKLTPGLPHVRERLAETYRQQGMVADALRELELAANELRARARSRRRCRRCAESSGCTRTTSRRASGWPRRRRRSGKVDEAVHELSQLAVQLKAQGRADDFVRVAERLLFHRPTDFARRARAGGGVHHAPEPAPRAGEAADGAEGGAARSAGTSRCWRRRWRSSIRRRRCRCGASWPRSTTPPGA